MLHRIRKHKCSKLEQRFRQVNVNIHYSKILFLGLILLSHFFTVYSQRISYLALSAFWCLLGTLKPHFSLENPFIILFFFFTIFVMPCLLVAFYGHFLFSLIWFVFGWVIFRFRCDFGKWTFVWNMYINLEDAWFFECMQYNAKDSLSLYWCFSSIFE